MIRLLAKLAFAGIRTRLGASVLTVAVAAAASSTIVIALEVRSSGLDPWQRTFDAANGAHVLAYVPSEADAQQIARLPGVTQHGDPVPLTSTTFAYQSGTDRLELAGIDGRPTVNRPVPTEGARLPGDGIVLERSVADVLGIDVGSTIEVRASEGSIELPVVGTAVLPSQPRYPRHNPGLAWVSRAVLARVEPDPDRWRWSEAVRLSDPTAAAALVERAAAAFPDAVRRSGEVSLSTWQAQRNEALLDAQATQIILTTFALLLLFVSFAVVGILVGARVSEQRREIGTLKAAGLTPRQIGVTYAIESVVLGLVAAGVGFAVGAIVAPRLAEPSTVTMVGSTTSVADPWHLLVAVGVVIPVLLLGAVRSARRSTRLSVVQAMRAGGATPPSSRLIRVVSRWLVPVAVEVGLRQLLARRRRALLLAGAITLTGAAIVAALSLHATLDARPSGEASDIPDELPLLVYTLDAVLLVITATTVVAVGYLVVREWIRDFGILRTVGLTPRQVTSVLVSGHAFLAIAAALLSIPLGIGLFLALSQVASGTTSEVEIAPWWSLAGLAVAMVLIVVAATIVPARLANRVPVATALRYE